jgi:hypothetical protein
MAYIDPKQQMSGRSKPAVMPPPPGGGMLGSVFGGGGGSATPPPPGGAMGPQPPQQGPFQPNPAGQMQPNQPFPSTPPQAPIGPNSPFTPLQPVPPATPAPALPYAPGGGPGSNANAEANFDGRFGAWNPNEKNQYGGQTIAGADPSQADYDSVQGYADQAYEESQRYMAPQHAMQNRRMQQELINKGIDPNSPQGQEMQKMMAMQQGDQQNAAQFQALQFGQGIQNQMSQQELANQGLAADMQKALWQNQLGSSGQNLQKYLGDQGFALGQGQLALGNQQANNQRYGQDLNYMLGLGGQDLQRYGMDQNYQLGQGNLDLGRQGQDFNQMIGLEGIDFRNRAYGDSRNDIQNQLIMQMLGLGGPSMGGGALDAGGAFGQTIGSAGQDKGLLGSLFG